MEAKRPMQIRPRTRRLYIKILRPWLKGVLIPKEIKCKYNLSNVQVVYRAIEWYKSENPQELTNKE